MQSDSHSHSSETSPVPPSPSSPPLSSVFHRHHPLPAPTPEAGDPSSPLRYQAADTRTVLIHVQTPFSDVGSSSSGKKGGWPVRWDMTVLELKREIAHGGLAGDEKWEGEGMRLVWQGRIARDEEKVGEIVGNVSIMEARLL